MIPEVNILHGKARVSNVNGAGWSGVGGGGGGGVVGVEFSKFSLKVGFRFFSHKKGGVGKIRELF